MGAGITLMGASPVLPVTAMMTFPFLLDFLTAPDRMERTRSDLTTFFCDVLPLSFCGELIFVAVLFGKPFFFDRSCLNLFSFPPYKQCGQR